jgi:DNA gyrase subunit B
MTKQQIEKQFNTRASIYDGRSAWIMDAGMLDSIVAAAEVPRDATLLDVCCGTGAVGGAFKGRVARRTGIDLTPGMLDVARERLDEVVQGDVRKLPFDDGRFGIVVSRQALHFFEDPSVPIAEMARVLAPGGQLVLCQRVPYGEADRAWWHELNRLKQPNLATFILERHLTDGMERAKLGKIEKRDYFLWESINDWVQSPEVPEANRDRILEHVRRAPAEVKKVHPFEIEGSSVRARWRWVIVSGWKR